ncbi:hypothetical protein BGZ89_002914 [Linnemannia elongata]|nr:hypothetical protein BGZ89_002914 [Linnemannia elongata]
MLNMNFSDDFSKLNFIGVVSLFGSEIALSALRYSVLVRQNFLSLYLAMVVSPGMQTDDKKEIIGLSASGGYKYIGLHSGTKMVVGSILGEALVKSSEVDFKNVKSTRSKQQTRSLHLKVLELDRLSEGASGLRMDADGGFTGIRAVVLSVIPLFTIVGIVLTLLTEDYGAAILILLNVVCNLAVTFTVRGTGVEYPNGTASPESPNGDAFIEL